MKKYNSNKKGDMYMKKIFYSALIVFVLSNLAVFADSISGGVSYDTNSARKYLQSGQVNEIAQPKKHLAFVDDSNIEKMTYSYLNPDQIMARTVVYKGDTMTAYIYDGTSNKLKYVDKYDKDINIYPHRGYRYNLSGKLVLTSLTIDSNEQFRFTPDGKLLAHSQNGVIYDEKGNIIGNCATTP